MKIVVGQGSCGIAAGAGKVYEALESAVKAKNSSANLTITGCIGMCYLEPIVDIYENDGTLHRFVKVDASKAEALVDAADTGDFSAVSDIAITDDDKAFLDKQTRIALRHCGVINPEDIEDYIGDDGYQGLKKVVCEMTPEEVIDRKSVV